MPARFATGIDYGADPALGPQDFHAYVEVYLSGRWWIFDPSGAAIPMGLVRLAPGRDAADSALATMFGSVQLRGMEVCFNVAPGPTGETQAPTHTELAISTTR